MAQYTGFLTNLIWVNILLAIFVVFFDKKSPQSTLMWVMVLYFLPIFGFILYLFFGLDTRKNKLFSLKEYQDRFLKMQSHKQMKKIVNDSYRFEDLESEEYKDLIRMNLIMDESFYTEDNSVTLYNWGEELFEQLFDDLERASKSIDLQSYIFKNDALGKKILEILTRKAKEGVEVRLLVDSLGARYLRKKHLKPLEDAGGKVAMFFKSFFRIINFRINYRNHRKIIIIDNQISYVGGYNIGDEYIGRDKKFGPWRDSHLRITGSGVFGLKIRFTKDWSYASGEDPEFLDEFYIDMATVDTAMVPVDKVTHDVAMQIITSGPDTSLPNIKNAMFKMIGSARKEIFIQTPYFVPDQSIMEALKTALISGVDVHIMIPSRKDHPFVFWANLNNCGELLKHGAKIYYYNKGFIHSKVLIVDDFLSTVGSANLDNRSFHLNFEVNCVMYDKAMNRRLKEQFYIDVKDSYLLTEELYESRTRKAKALESISRLLSPIL
ncbi:MAG: cardiolipin synthase [Tissierellia bacterium]|nr:cardiolipin synthase [Tissierellia bacterium]